MTHNPDQGEMVAIPDENLGLWCFNTEDGEPWAVFLYGHKDPSLFTLEKVNEALEDAGHEPIEQFVVEHLWMREDDEDRGEDGMFPWHWCSAGDEGAVAITGVQF